MGFAADFLLHSQRLHNQARHQLPYRLRTVLDHRDQVLGSDMKAKLSSAWDLHDDAPRCLIYAWVHEKDSLRVYIGCILGGAQSSFLNRTQQHFAAANTRMQAPQGAIPANASTPFQLYDYMAARGLSDLVCIPLQVLHASSTNKQTNDLEERWIARFNAIQQVYNTRHASSRVSYAPHVGGFAHRRLFGWHDMHKRLLTLQVARDTRRLRYAMYPQPLSTDGRQDNVLAFSAATSSTPLLSYMLQWL